MKMHGLLGFFRPISRISLALVILCSGLLPVGISALSVTPVHAAGPAWYDGLIQYSTITNCVSIIQGAPYTEKGAGTYVGYLANPDAAQPGPNDVYYVHVVVAGLGNACSGMRAYIDLGLPANTVPAVDTTNKVYCFYDSVALTPASDCPQTLYPSAYNPGMFELRSPDSAHANTWPIPIGKFLEIQVPVRSSTALSNSTLSARVWMLDGNSSPWLQPQQGVYVFSSLPSILYPSPSTTLIQSTTAHSEVYLYTHGVGGTGYFDLGTDTNYSMIHEPVTIVSGGNAFLAWDDWGPPALLPDTLYHWRFTFTYAGGQTIGADQTFRTLPDNTASVGSGATGSCTETALSNALATGKKVTFACGPLPVTITLTSAKSITGNTVIDGGNLVTLSTSGASGHFDVQSSGHLFLSNIKLVNGSSTTCGGSIHVLANGFLTVTETTFDNNVTTYKGGAICIETTGSAEIHSTTFTNNHANNSGGAVFNGGTLTLATSTFSTNSALYAFGGAIQNWGTGSIQDTSFNQNNAAINGGGIDAGGTLTILRGKFNGNVAGIRGGGVNEYGGVLTIEQSSFIDNHSNGYGGGIVNDAGTVTLKTSELTGNSAVSVGGGLRSQGITTVENSTFSGNHSDANGGGIENSETTGRLTLLNTTLVGNTAGGQGGNLYINLNTSDHISMKNSLVAAGSPNNCDHPVSSQGNNLESANTCGLAAGGDQVNVTPKLGPLQLNGGPTRTYALLRGSPAIDHANNTGCPVIDQRGTVRPQDGDRNGTATCDIGAYEFIWTDLKVFIPALRK